MTTTKQLLDEDINIEVNREEFFAVLGKTLEHFQNAGFPFGVPATKMNEQESYDFIEYCDCLANYPEENPTLNFLEVKHSIASIYDKYPFFEYLRRQAKKINEETNDIIGKNEVFLIAKSYVDLYMSKQSETTTNKIRNKKIG